MKNEMASATTGRTSLICFALKEEAVAFRKLAAGRAGVSTLIVGIGRQNAGKSIREFLDSGRRRGGESQIQSENQKSKIENQSVSPHVVSYKPKLVLTCGFAGGLNPDLKLGDVVFEFPSDGCRGDEAQISTGNLLDALPCPTLRDCHEKLVAAGAQPAKFFCANRIATTVAEKKRLREETGADVVEMESAAIHAVCQEHGIPCVTVRVISDTANEDLPLDFNALSKPDKSLDFGKLAWSIAKSPGKIGALMALQKKTSLAAERLATVLAKLLFGKD